MLTRTSEITPEQARQELWGAIGDLMPYPCDPDWNECGAVLVSPKPSGRPHSGGPRRQPIVIRFGDRGLGKYRCCCDVMRQRVRIDVVYVVTMMLRAYNFGLNAPRTRDLPFVIDCELLLYAENIQPGLFAADGH